MGELMGPTEHLDWIIERNQECYIRNSQWYVFFYSQENLVQLDKIKLLAAVGPDRIRFYQALLTLLERISYESYTLSASSLRLSDMYLVEGNWGDLLVPRFDKMVDPHVAPTARKLAVSYLYNVIRRVEAMRARVELDNVPRPLTDLCDPYVRFMRYFVKHGEVGPSYLSFDIIKTVLSQTSNIPQSRIWGNTWVTTPTIERVRANMRKFNFINVLNDVEARIWREKFKLKKIFPRSSGLQPPKNKIFSQKRSMTTSASSQNYSSESATGPFKRARASSPSSRARTASAASRSSSNDRLRSPHRPFAPRTFPPLRHSASPRVDASGQRFSQYRSGLSNAGQTFDASVSSSSSSASDFHPSPDFCGLSGGMKEVRSDIYAILQSFKTLSISSSRSSSADSSSLTASTSRSSSSSSSASRRRSRPHSRMKT